jgi:hypothetical protein
VKGKREEPTATTFQQQDSGREADDSAMLSVIHSSREVIPILIPVPPLASTRSSTSDTALERRFEVKPTDTRGSPKKSIRGLATTCHVVIPSCMSFIIDCWPYQSFVERCAEDLVFRSKGETLTCVTALVS